MNQLKQVRVVCGITVATFALAFSAAAQGPMPGLGQPPGMKASLTKLFGDFTAFSAQANMRMVDASGKETMTMAMDMTLLDGKVRTDIDMGQMKSAMMPPMAVASLKQMGMDRMTSVLRPDHKKMYVVYSSLKAYAEMPIDDEQVAALGKDPKIEKTELGTETIDGRECVKTKVLVSDGSDDKQEGLMWFAKEPKNFPIQMQFTEDGNTVTMLFKGIKTDKPDAARFDPPAGYTKHASLQELMQSAAMKMLGGGAGKN